MTITGTNLIGDTTVKFRNGALSPAVVAPTKITFVTSARSSATGRVPSVCPPAAAC